MSERRRRTHFDPLRRGFQGGHVDVAPAQEAEQALHENHQQYRALFGQMLEGVAYCQMLFDEAGQPVDWIYLEVNAAFEALTGLRDAAGKRVTRLIPGVRETNPELFEFYGRVAKTGVPEQFETYLAALERWFSVKVYRPQAGHVAAVFENISEARRTEQALRDSAALLNEMQELARIGGWAYDVASETVSWTDEVYRIHEVSPHEYNPNSAEQDIEFYAPEDQGRIDKAFRLAVEEGRPYDLELRLVTAKGREIRVRTAAQPQLQDGRVVRIYGHIQDITERKAAEEEIQGAHDLLRQFFDANIIGTLVVRDSGATLEANDYFLNLIGRTREELERGEIDWRAITPPEWLPVSDHAIGEMRARGAYDPYEKEYLRPDGTRVPVLVAATSLSGPGELIAAFVLDNTERKRAEAEVLTLNAELEDRVVARTAALEAANRELEAFSYSRQPRPPSPVALDQRLQ